MNAVYENLVIRSAVANFAESLVHASLHGNVEDIHSEMEQFCCFIMSELTSARTIGRMSAVTDSTN